jgi:hypothetical protein
MNSIISYLFLIHRKYKVNDLEVSQIHSGSDRNGTGHLVCSYKSISFQGKLLFSLLSRAVIMYTGRLTP